MCPDASSLRRQTSTVWDVLIRNQENPFARDKGWKETWDSIGNVWLDHHPSRPNLVSLAARAVEARAEKPVAQDLVDRAGNAFHFFRLLPHQGSSHRPLVDASQVKSDATALMSRVSNTCFGYPSSATRIIARPTFSVFVTMLGNRAFQTG